MSRTESTLRRLIAGATALAAVGCVASAHAQITPVSRLSDVSFDASGLGHPAGGPDAHEETTSPSAAFDETLAGQVVNEEPGGALNEGIWTVTQSSVIEDYAVSASLTQTATVATDFGSPGIFNRSKFDFAFMVAATVDAGLTGSYIGSSALGSGDFARVQLKRGNVTVFNTGFGHSFPWPVTLEPGFDYRLIVEVSGEAEFNASSSSSSIAILTLDAPEADADGDGVPDNLDNCTQVPNPTQLDSDSDGIGNACDADIDGDCSVSFGDLARLKAAFFPNPYDPDADFDGDGFVNFGDLAFMKATFFNSADPGPGPSGMVNGCGP